jgi:predicted nuclease of predicted toxin-antitoxin system
VRILADENVEQLVIERLRADGHTVIAVRVESRGETNLPILERAVTEDLLLLTADLDFGEYIFRDRQPAPKAGVVQYRLGDILKEAEKAQIIGEAFVQHSASLAGNFTVIEENKVRLRPFPR